MEYLIVTAVLVLPLLVWLIVGYRLDTKRAVAEQRGDVHVAWYRRHIRLLITLVVAIDLIPVAIWSVYGFDWGGNPGTPWPDWMNIPLFLGVLMWQITVVGALGWLFTRAARSRLRSRPFRGAEPILLEGRRLRVARGFWLTVFIAGIATSLAYLAGLWTEANRVGTVADSGIGIDYFYVMNPRMALALNGSQTVPDWYPWLVVLRQATALALAFGLAWFIYKRSSRHWMALFTSLLIAVTPFALFGDGSTLRFESVAGVGLVAAALGDAVGVLGFVMLAALFFVFPDGRFRGTFVKLVLSVLLAAVVLFPLVEAELVSGDWGWFLGVLGFLALVGSAIAVQLFRYSEAQPEDRKVARALFVSLILLGLWLIPGQALYTAFDGRGWGPFIWQQAYLTLYLFTPVVLGLGILYLIRRQGWWDMKLFVGRTAVVAALVPVLAVGYVAIILVLTAGSRLVFGDSSQAIAILLATTAVALAYRPLQEAFQRWVDRRWFPSRARANTALAAFTDDIRDEVAGMAVRDRLLEAVDGALAPESMGVWLPETGEALS